MPQTDAFFGNPQATLQGQIGRTNLSRTYENTWIDDFLGGVAGQQSPSGGIMQPDYDTHVTANNAGQIAGIVSGVAPLGKISGLIGKGLGAIGKTSKPLKLIGGLERHVASTAPWDETAKAYNMSTQDAMQQAMKLVGPDELTRLAKAHPISTATPEWEAISNEMTARAIVDFFDSTRRPRP